jgi:sarcosine oxidase subunit alpha
MGGRCAPLRDPITIRLDGEPVPAARGEPVAAALIAADKLAMARSPKFHRPRGPSCMHGACDGCLARVDDVPNVMTCMVGAREGMEVVSQNTLGSREIDVLRMTDWFFPQGMNHHELFAGVPGLQNVMQAFARRVAGLGRLPAREVGARGARRRELDVVVVGAGPAGMTVAALAAARGRAVEVVDDALEPGGSLRALAGEDVRAWGEVRRAFDAAVEGGRVHARSSTTAGAVYGNDLLIAGPSGAEVVTARAIVLAAGAHDGVLPFEGNDVPGVMSARAAGVLLSRGVLLGERVVVVVAPGGGPFGEAYARAVSALRAPCAVTVVHGDPVRVAGASAVGGVTVRIERRERKLGADALLVDAPRAPAYELCEQAGAKLSYTPRGFLPALEGGRVREGIWVVGEAAGVPFDPDAIRADAQRVAAQL